jgi:ABC-2 type transport system permease protein
MMNNLRNSFRMSKKDLKILFKDRGQLAVIFGLPLLLGLVICGIYSAVLDPVKPSGESRLVIRARIVNEDQGPYGAQVVEVLDSIQMLSLTRSPTADAADERVAEGEAAAAIIIPPDFSAQIDANQPVRIQFIKDPTQQVEAQTAAQILNQALTELSTRAEIEYGIRAVYAKTGALEGADPEVARATQAQIMGAIWTGVQEISQNPAIAVEREDLAGAETVLSVSSVISASFMPLFSTMFAFFLVGFMAESILGEKEAGSFRRLLSAPIHRGTIIAGKMLAFIGVVFLQMLLLFGLGSALFDMPLGDSPLALVALTLALALASTGMGMALGSLARTRNQAGNIGMVLGFVLYLGSGLTSTGAYLSNPAFQSEGLTYYLALLTPVAHAYDGYIKLMLNGGGLSDTLPNMLALLGFGVVFFLIGVWRFKYE